MKPPLNMECVIPSRLRVGEAFAAKVKVLGAVYEVGCAAQWNTPKPRRKGPFNLNVQRGIRFMDNVLPEWRGRLSVSADGGQGPGEIVFDGKNQGVFPGDTRPIGTFSGWCWRETGFHFLRLKDRETGLEVLSNPCYVSEEEPAVRLFWGDPHWQTFFSDGIRCPEELYAFARDEAFLDFGAISDHMEAITDRQWDYFKAVANDFNRPGEFATLLGQEWTHHVPETGAPGHRNVYYRGDDGPALRCTDPDCDTLEKLWRTLDSLQEVEAIAIPHHPANRVMGVKWELGWNAAYEKVVEIYSVWGSSEKSEAEGNSRPIRNNGGEMKGRHVRDALGRGYRMGFVGGGDVHDGRAGAALHTESYPPSGGTQYDNGLAAVWAPSLRREHVFDALRGANTYAATRSRIYLEVCPGTAGMGNAVRIRAASEQGLAKLVKVTQGKEIELPVSPGALSIEDTFDIGSGNSGEYTYFRLETTGGEMAWSSPVWSE